jgi:hypothetical protein
MEKGKDATRRNRFRDLTFLCLAIVAYVRSSHPTNSWDLSRWDQQRIPGGNVGCSIA